jgi:tetratricopeptide (TPR) repeat protein
MLEQDYISLRLALSSTLGEFFMSEAGFSIPIGLYQSAGFTWLTKGASPIDSVGWNGEMPQLTNISYREQQNLFVLSYAINPWNRLTVGANLDIIHRYLWDAQYFGVGFDLGATYRLIRHPIWGYHLIGLSTQNLYNIILDSEDELSRNVKFSWNGSFVENRIEAALEYNLRDLLPDDSAFTAWNEATQSFIGTETELEWSVTGRLGGWILQIFKLYWLYGFDMEGIDYWGLSIGVNVPSVNIGRDMMFAYQYLSVVEGIAASHSYYMKVDIGKHREEVYARKMARHVNVEPNDLYERAMRFYYKGNYWDAFYIYNKILVEYPDFFKNDWVTYYAGSCQEELDMRQSARQRYDNTLDSYGRSTVRHFASLGKIRIVYRNEEYTQVSRLYTTYMQSEAFDSLKHHATYIMGQTYMAQGEYGKAIQLFDDIPDAHPDYAFAQHSLGVSHIHRGDNEKAVDAFRNCLGAVTPTKKAEEIVNRSRLMLGYMLYEGMTTEENAIAKAVTLLRQVPATSIYYQDALLGLGWLAMKARQWVDCENAGQQLQQISSFRTVKAEGALLQGYALMRLGESNRTVEILDKALKEIRKYSKPTPEEKEKKRVAYLVVRNNYQNLAGTMNNFADTRQSSTILQRIDSLHTQQKEIRDEISEYYDFFDSFDRERLFARNLETIMEDMEYLLATVEKKAGTERIRKMQKKYKTEQEELDEEIQRLEQEMEELEEDETTKQPLERGEKVEEEQERESEEKEETE